MTVSWLDEVNPAQREAVRYGGGPLLVVAGAGTGKTKTLACRVAYLIGQGVEPGRTLADCSGKASDGGSSETGTTDTSQRKGVAIAVQIVRICCVYQPILERRYENAAAWQRDLEQLGRMASRYRSRGRFITDLTLDPPVWTSDLAQAPHLDEDWLTLSTIHSAKGCEWTVVHIIHAADGMIPSDMALRDEAGEKEERRLFYVAMTRAQDRLDVYSPLRYCHQRFGLGDQHGYAQLTRFMSDNVRALFEQATGPADDRGETLDEQGADEPSHIEGINARLRRLWSDGRGDRIGRPT